MTPTTSTPYELGAAHGSGAGRKPSLEHCALCGLSRDSQRFQIASGRGCTETGCPVRIEMSKPQNTKSAGTDASAPRS